MAKPPRPRNPGEIVPMFKVDELAASQQCNAPIVRVAANSIGINRFRWMRGLTFFVFLSPAYISLHPTGPEPLNSAKIRGLLRHQWPRSREFAQKPRRICHKHADFWAAVP
jgi:hypothetical protein